MGFGSLRDYRGHDPTEVVRMRGTRLRYLPGHSKGRRREVYAVESRHWAQLQKGPNKAEERKRWRKTNKEEKKEEEEDFGCGEGQGEVK